MTRKNRHLAEWRLFVKFRRADRVVRPYEETDSHASVSTGSE